MSQLSNHAPWESNVPWVSKPEKYPPEHHILRDIGLDSERPEPGRALSCAPISPAVLTPFETARLGLIGATADASGALTVLTEALPDRIATLVRHDDRNAIVTVELVDAGRGNLLAGHAVILFVLP